MTCLVGCACPPSIAVPASGVVYRVTKNNPHTATDMETHDEQGLAKKHPDPCARCALSVVLVDEELDLLREKYRKIGDYSAKGELRADLGVMLTDGTATPTHTNVWFYKNVTPDLRAGLFTFHRSLT
jgi:hypothetical protein